MPAITPALLKAYTDRISEQYILLKTAIQDAKAEGGGRYYARIHIGVGTGDTTVEKDFIIPSINLDNDLSSGVLAKQYYSDIINTIETHAVGVGLKTLDNFANISGINFSPYFEEVYYFNKSKHLQARNVFENPAGTICGVVTFTGSSVATYVHGNAVGTGTGVVSLTNHAASNLKAVPTVPVGGTDIILDLRLLAEKYPDGSVAAQKTVTIPNGTAAGTEIAIGTPGTDMYLDVTNAFVAGGSAGDAVKFVSTQERVEAL